MSIPCSTQVRALATGLIIAQTLGVPRAVHGQEPHRTQPSVASAPLHLASQAPPANRPDSLVNGTLTGAAVGFGAGFLIFATVNARATDSGPVWSDENVGYYTGAGIIGAGVGALIGALTDASIRRNTRPSPGRTSVAVMPVYRRAAYGVRITLLY